MAIRTDFVAGEVLAAQDLDDTFAAKSDYALPVDLETGTTYTFTLANARQLVTASNAGTKTFTIPPQSSVVWLANTVIRVANYGAGALTINGGVGVTVTNTATTIPQYGSAVAVRTASDAWTLLPFAGGAGDADFSNAATGTYTGFKYVTFTGSGTLTVTKAGLCDVVVVGGGAGAANRTDGVGFGYGGGGAGGVIQATNHYLAVGTYTVTIGAGGVLGGGETATDSALGTVLTACGGAGISTTAFGGKGGSGAGGGEGATGGPGTLNQGNAGGNGVSPRGGGGGGAGGVGLATNPPNGGPGTTTSIAGTTPSGAYVAGTYAIGGGGGGGGTASTGGTGGGGNGTGYAGTPTNGTANRGGGGGGGGGNSGGPSGTNGGSGIVIVRVRV